MFKYLIAGAAAAYAVYKLIVGGGSDPDDTPPRHQPPPYEPHPRPLVRNYDERQSSRPSQTYERVSRQQRGARYDERQYQPDETPTVEPESPESLRARAKREGHSMSQCYEQSKDAYERRDGALAKALSEQGKRHALQMEQLNKQASALIFKENNKNNDPYTIDLHGLYIKEAIAYSERAVSKARRKSVSEVRLIVGQGNHSDGGVARLKPALQNDMKTRGFRVEVDPRNTGVLVVQMNDN